MPHLIVEKGNDKGKAFLVQPKTGLVVGRDASAAAQLRDTMASRQHFRIENRADGYWVVDLGSMNGTVLNGKPVEKEQKLAFGDLIRVGETLFSFVAEESAPGGTLIGQRWGGYKIIERIGRGGMGTVYKAEQIDLQRIVALKVISPEHARNKEFIELFVHEARAAARLNHANIVQVYDVKKHNELYYFSMEYVPGGSVQDLLGKQRKLPTEQVVQMMLDAARGLEYAHKKGIIHRDIKPDNLMIAEDGSIKIGDLGLAQRLGEKLSADDEHSVIGTPHYIAPELVMGRSADFRSDLYSLGSTMYRMAAGFTPYQAPSVRELVNKKVREDAVPLHEAVPGIPGRIGEICTRMMARKPEDRYGTMTEAIIDLEAYQHENAGSPLRRASGSPTEGVAVNRRLLWAAVVLLSVVVLGGVIGAAAYWKVEPAPAVAPSTDGRREDKAGHALDLAKEFEIKRMDPNKPEDLQRAIREFGGVVERYKGTEAAKEAEQRVEELAKRLRETSAALAFVEVERQDRENWRKMYQAFQGGVADLSAIDETIAAYERFAQAEVTRETSSGGEARVRANFVAGWKKRVDELRAAFEKAREEAVRKRDEERFNAAWMMLDEFAQTALAGKVGCPFASDRYASLLFEEAAREEQKKVMEAARVAYYRIEEQVRDLERAGKFEQAIRRLEPAEHYPDEIRLRALARRNALGDAWARYRAEEAERAAREAETALAADEEEFGRVSREARRDVAAYDFGSAETKFASAEARLRTEKFRGRVLRRAAEMARLVDFKDTLRTMVNDPRSYPAFKREATFLGAGTIVKMDEREFTIRADGSGGTIGLGLKEIRSAAFYRFARGAWKWTDPKVVEALVIFCCEWGMYESALEEIAALQPWIDKDKAVAEFCETYKALIDAGDYSEWEEIEAEKRYGRLRQFAADGVLDDARREADILRTRYNATKFVANRKGEIEALLEEVLKQGGEDLKKKRRGEQYKRIQNSRSGARSQAGRNQPEILARLGQIRDALERDARLGEMYAAYGDWNRSTERLLEAKPLADRVLADRKQVREYALQVASVYVQLLRNAVVTGNRQGAIDWRNEAHAKFSDREWPAIAAWWAEVIRKVEQWEPLFREKSKAMSGLEKALREAPDEPERLWAVIEACWVTRDLMDARGYLRAYLEMFPDAPEARNGEAQYRLAETLLSFHEVKEALDLYRALARQYPEHPKVKDKKAEDGVERRWELCHDLMNKMGIKKEEGK